MRLLKTLLMISLVFSLGACQMAPQSKMDNELFSLMPIPEGFDGGGWLEKFQFSGVVEQSMLVSTEFSGSSIQVAALTFEGVPLSQLQFDPVTQKLTTQSTLSVDFDGRKIIYDMQSVFWPLAMLKDNMLADTHVIEINTSGHRIRQFYRDETLTREITYTGALTQLVEFEQNYRLEIERLEEY